MKSEYVNCDYVYNVWQQIFCASNFIIIFLRQHCLVQNIKYISIYFNPTVY
jgi:hypothetical protein